MICRNCYKAIVQQVGDNKKDFTSRCVWPNECDDLVDFNKWWDDQVRCTSGGWHHMKVGHELISFGPHEPHTVNGRPIYPVYLTELGEEVLGDQEQNGMTAYRDMWPHPHKKTRGLFVK